MLLKGFPNIVVDELPEKPDPGKLYFSSRPIYNVATYDQTNRINIFTTKEIRKFMIKATHAIPGQFIQAIDDCRVTPANRAIEIHTIRTGSAGGNVMYMFHYVDDATKQTLYTGEFTEIGLTFCDRRLNAAIKSRSIINLYVDNTIANATAANSEISAANWIVKIRKKYPEHRIYVSADELGCEHLLYYLATVRKLRIYLNKTRRLLLTILGTIHPFCDNKDQADILVFEQLPPHKMSTFKSAFNSANMNIRLITTEKKSKPIGVKWIDDVKKEFIIEDGIVYIPYAPHPSAGMLLSLLNVVKPRHVIKMANTQSYGRCTGMQVQQRDSSAQFTVEDGVSDVEQFYETKLSSAWDHQGTIIGRDNEKGKKRSFLAASSSETSTEDPACKKNKNE